MVRGFKKAYLNKLRSKRLREEEDLTIRELSTWLQRNDLQRCQFLFQYIYNSSPKLQSKFLRIHGNLECTSPYETLLFRQLAFNKINYMRELNYRERYHMQELMSFQFYYDFVANFIVTKIRYMIIAITYVAIACANEKTFNSTLAAT